MLTYDDRLDTMLPALARQAYLLTSDPDRARALARQATEAVRTRVHPDDPASAEQARIELVRAFLAGPEGPRPAAPTGAPAHPDVAVWVAVRRLPPRRRAAIVLRYDESLTEEHSAARLGVSAQSVRADVDAALLTLRTALPGVQDPWTHIADALNAAGRGWSDYAGPAPARVAEVLAAPRPEPRRQTTDAAAGRRFGGRAAGLAMVGVAAVLLAVGVVVPRLGGDAAPVVPAAAAAKPGQAAPQRVGARLTVPTRAVPKGLLNWPARGDLNEQPALAAAATRAWRAKVPAAEAPATGTGVLWAGLLQGRTVAVLQSLDRAGHPRIAQLDGRSAGTMTLRHAEPLHAGTAVLSLLPPSGPSGPVRVLVSPEVQIADGLLAVNPMDGSPLRPTPVGPDGVSGVLPSPPGSPTCSRVVLLGLDYTGGPTSGSNVLYSGIVAANMLGGMPAEVEVGSPTLAPAGNASPQTRWFTDGTRLAGKVPGTGTLTVATLGPALDAQPLTATDRRPVSARAYELRRGPARYLGSIVEVGGKTVCASVFPLGSARAAFALRCPVPGGTTGVIHVVGAAGVSSVDLSLAATPAPAGQRAHTGNVQRPADVPAEVGFAALEVVPAGFPCGAGTLTVHRENGDETQLLAVYRP